MTGIQRYGSVLSLSKLYIQVKEIRLEGEAAYLNLERYSVCGVFRKSSSSNFNSRFRQPAKRASFSILVMKTSINLSARW